MVLRRLIVSAGIAVLFAAASVAASRENVGAQPTQPSCTLPVSDAEALVILNAYYPNRYRVERRGHHGRRRGGHPTVWAEHRLAEVRRAIATWSAVLEECFDGRITLTDVTDRKTGSKRQAADIVVHYVPTAGGTVFGGYAICGVTQLPQHPGPLGPAAQPRTRTRTAPSTSTT